MGDECNFYNFRFLLYLLVILVILFKRYEKCFSYVKVDKLIYLV